MIIREVISHFMKELLNKLRTKSLFQEKKVQNLKNNLLKESGEEISIG